MSYATTPRYEAEILSRNRLAPSPEPAMGNNPGRNAPLNRTDDTMFYQIPMTLDIEVFLIVVIVLWN
jgi:hypothetical protein